MELQAQVYVSGFVKDSASGERLIGATLMDLSSKKGCVSDQQGYFSLKLERETKLQVSYVGFQTKVIPLKSLKDTILEVELSSGNTLSVVEVKAAYVPKVHVATLSMRDILQIPHITGKPDVLKALQFIPGIRSQGEMSSVTLVRGGNPGENLYLIDQTPLIYVHHIGGFMSVFNPDMINEVEVYKGAFPAKYGGRLSSVMNISQKEGNKSGFQGSVSIGISDIGLTLEGPTPLKNSSFIITGRKTFTELYYLLVTSLSSTSPAAMAYGFHDINGKFSWRPNSKNSLHFNIFQGDDYLELFSKSNSSLGNHEKFKTESIWGNFLVSANWKRAVSPKIFLNNTLSYTRYRLRNTEKMEAKDWTHKGFAKSGMQELSLCSDAKYRMSDYWDMDFGLKLSYLMFQPIFLGGDYVLDPLAEQDIVHAFNAGLYWDNKLRLWKVLDVKFGLRWENYFTRNFFHSSPEPRIGLSYFFLPEQSFHINYMRVSQNAQLLYNTGNLSANEIYIPSGRNVPVAFSDQVGIGWNARFLEGILQLEINVYYKTLQNLSTYKEGFNYAVGDRYWRDKLETGGLGKAAGAEFFLKKTRGKWTGFIGYAYSKSVRQYENINKGKAFDFEFDSPHNISLNVGYAISEKWSVGLTWQFQSGLPYTPAIGKYTTVDIDEEGNYLPYEVLIYGEKNSGRMRAYHRLDFAFKYSGFTKKRNLKQEWTLGLYNAYNRRNPYYYYYNNTANGEMYNPRIWGVIEDFNLYQMSMFPIMPMVSYKVWFGHNSGKKSKPKQEEKKRKSRSLFFYDE